VFAVWALNHHGDGHVGLWLDTPALEQSRLLASSKHCSSRRTWAVGLDRHRAQQGSSVDARRELVHMAYANSFAAETRRAGAEAAGGGRADGEDEARGDRPPAGAARAEGARDHAQDRRALPETDEGVQMGRCSGATARRRSLTLYDYGKGLAAQFWVGIERQGRSKWIRASDPPYQGHNGWMRSTLERIDPRAARSSRSRVIGTSHRDARIASLDANKRVA
jgi:hypothetical protein